MNEFYETLKKAQRQALDLEMELYNDIIEMEESEQGENAVYKRIKEQQINSLNHFQHEIDNIIFDVFV